MSFTVPFTDDQIEVDAERRVVMVFRNAWNRESSGTPDETYAFDTLLADAGLMESVLTRLTDGDAAEARRALGRAPD